MLAACVSRVAQSSLLPPTAAEEMPDSATDQVEVFETIDELVAAISPSETDVIVLCGLPGCGKSSFTVCSIGHVSRPEILLESRSAAA